MTQILSGRRTARRAGYRSVVFDCNVARVSTLTTAIGYTLMALSPSGVLFTLSTVIRSCGQGYLPAAQSVASLLHSRSGKDEAGRLFGALGVVYVLGYVFMLSNINSMKLTACCAVAGSLAPPSTVLCMLPPSPFGHPRYFGYQRASWL